MGASSLADRMSNQLVAAQFAVGNIPGNLGDAIVNDLESVTDAYGEVQLFTTPMKSEFVSVLNLTIPQEGAGDND